MHSHQTRRRRRSWATAIIAAVGTKLYWNEVSSFQSPLLAEINLGITIETSDNGLINGELFGGFLNPIPARLF